MDTPRVHAGRIDRAHPVRICVIGGLVPPRDPATAGPKVHGRAGDRGRGRIAMMRPQAGSGWRWTMLASIRSWFEPSSRNDVNGRRSRR